MDTNQKDYIDAKVDAVRAQNDARFAEVIAKLDALHAEQRAAVAHMPTRWTMFGTAAAAVVTALGLGVAILAFGGDRFDGGVQVSSASTRDAIEARQIAEDNARQVKALGTKMDTLIELMSKRVQQ